MNICCITSDASYHFFKKQLRFTRSLDMNKDNLGVIISTVQQTPLHNLYPCWGCPRLSTARSNRVHILCQQKHATSALEKPLVETLWKKQAFMEFPSALWPSWNQSSHLASSNSTFKQTWTIWWRGYRIPVHSLGTHRANNNNQRQAGSRVVRGMSANNQQATVSQILMHRPWDASKPPPDLSVQATLRISSYHKFGTS